MASAYVSALKREREVPHIIFWVDNCTGENTNWCLLATVVSIVNYKTTAINDVTLKYFETRAHIYEC